MGARLGVVGGAGEELFEARPDPAECGALRADEERLARGLEGAPRRGTAPKPDGYMSIMKKYNVLYISRHLSETKHDKS